MHLIKAIAIASAMLVVGMSAAGAQQPNYAVLSLVGDKLTLLAQRHQVGSRTESQPKQETELEDQVFDQAAVVAARASLLTAVPGAKPLLMMTQDKALYRAQNAMFEQPEGYQEDRDYLRSLLAQQGATHLVLVSKHRSQAELKMYNSVESGAWFEGLGFYIDDVTVTRNMNTSTSAKGMVVPYAYVKIRLLDARDLRVLGESVAKASQIYAPPSDEPAGMATFAAMSVAEKTGQIRKMLERAVGEALPPLLQQ